MSTPENLRHVATLARAVALLRQSPEPGKRQKDALRALVALAAERSATFRFYGDTLTLDGAEVPTTDPRLGAFTERLVAQNVAEITIAKGAGPDELLALTLGLAADPGQGRIKERLRDAGSARVMVVLHQFDAHATGSVSGAFEKVKANQGVMAEWDKSFERFAKVDWDRVANSKPAGREESERDARSGAPPEAPAALPVTAELPPPPAPVPPLAAPRQPRPSAVQEATSPEAWFAAFERSVKNKFPDHFGSADWGFRIDRAAGTVSAGDRQGRSRVSVSLPRDHLEQSAWLVAGKLLDELHKLAEKEGAIRKRR